MKASSKAAISSVFHFSTVGSIHCFNVALTSHCFLLHDRHARPTGRAQHTREGCSCERLVSVTALSPTTHGTCTMILLLTGLHSPPACLTGQTPYTSSGNLCCPRSQFKCCSAQEEESHWRCKAQRTQNPRLSSYLNTCSKWWAKGRGTHNNLMVELQEAFGSLQL